MSIKLTPVNRMLLVNKEESKKHKPDEFGFVLPEKTSLAKHVVVELKAAPEGSIYERYVGQKLLVNNIMIEIVEINNNYYSLISETGVVGIITESELF